MELTKPGLWQDNSLTSSDSRTQSSKKQIEFWTIKSYGLLLLIPKREQCFSLKYGTNNMSYSGQKQQVP